MLITGLAGIVLIEIYAAVMQREFQNTNNRVGKGFAILGIYLFVVCYCKWTSVVITRCGDGLVLGKGSPGSTWVTALLTSWVFVQMVCSTAQPGSTVQRSYPSRFAAK